MPAFEITDSYKLIKKKNSKLFYWNWFRSKGRNQFFIPFSHTIFLNPSQTAPDDIFQVAQNIRC